jgi:hypothetical protein
MPSDVEIEPAAHIRILLTTFDPPEALGLLGDLADDTFALFKPIGRLDLADEWTTKLLERVRQSVDTARKKRRD